MSTYRTRETFEAKRWWKHGDLTDDIQPLAIERLEGSRFDCRICGKRLYDHGSILMFSKPMVVCPGDYIMPEDDGSLLAVRQETFVELYELAGEAV